MEEIWESFKDWWSKQNIQIKGLLVGGVILILGFMYWYGLEDTNITAEDSAPFIGRKWVGSWSDDIGGGIQKTYILELFPSKEDEGRYEYQLDIHEYAPPTAYGAGFENFKTHRGLMAEETEEYCQEIKYTNYCGYIWRCEGDGKEVSIISKYGGSSDGEAYDDPVETAGKFCAKDYYSGQFRLFNSKGDSYRVINVDGRSYKDTYEYRGASGEAKYEFKKANNEVDRTEIWLDGELVSCEGNCK